MFKKTVMVLALLALVCGAASAKKMAVLNFNKGDMTDDNNNTVVSLSDENSEKAGDFTMKCDFSEKSKSPWAAVFQPKKATWSGFTKIKLGVFNPGTEDLKFAWMIKGAKMSNGPDNRKDWELTAKPGKNLLEVKLTDVICNDGKSQLDISKIFIWALWNLEEKPVTLYFSKISLEDESK
ncbi:MAG: hypothetical protein WCI43_07245 [Candidatus Firestonebacteria bacterium]